MSLACNLFMCLCEEYVPVCARQTETGGGEFVKIQLKAKPAFHEAGFYNTLQKLQEFESLMNFKNSFFLFLAYLLKIGKNFT